MSPETSSKPYRRNRPRVSLLVLAGGLAIAYAPNDVPGLARTVGIEAPFGGPANILIWNWLAVGALLLYVFRVEKLDWSSLRLVRPTERDLEWAGWIGGGLMAWAWGMSMLLPAEAQRHAGEAQDTLVGVGPVLALGLVLTAGITEEILWRGYAVERAAAWIGPWAASIIGLAVFAYGHLDFFGPGWLLTGLPTAAMFYIMLTCRRNLWAAILVHLLADSPIFILSVLALF